MAQHRCPHAKPRRAGKAGHYFDRLPCKSHVQISGRFGALTFRLTAFVQVYKVCSPTRASFMTGRLPNRAGLHNFISHDDPSAISAKYFLLPQALKTAGYQTHTVGKW